RSRTTRCRAASDRRSPKRWRASLFRSRYWRSPTRSSHRAEKRSCSSSSGSTRLVSPRECADSWATANRCRSRPRNPAVRLRQMGISRDALAAGRAYQEQLLALLGKDDPARVMELTEPLLRTVLSDAASDLRKRPAPAEWSVLEL